MDLSVILSCDPDHLTNLFSSFLRSLRKKVEFKWPSFREDVWNIDGRTPKSLVYYQHTISLRLGWAKSIPTSYKCFKMFFSRTRRSISLCFRVQFWGYQACQVCLVDLYTYIMSRSHLIPYIFKRNTFSKFDILNYCSQSYYMYYM